MIMWIMPDRAIPRSFRMMEGFGVYTSDTKGDSTQSQRPSISLVPLRKVFSN